MIMFKSEGTFKVEILDVAAAEPRFAQPPAFDICIQVQDVNDESQVDWWRGEMSANYGKGNFADRTQTQITMANLGKIGFEGSDLTTLHKQLVGKTTMATTKASKPTAEGKVFFNVAYLGNSGNAPEVINAGEMAKRLAVLTGGVAAAAPVVSADDDNPFA
jgi:hypothetical protein